MSDSRFNRIDQKALTIKKRFRLTPQRASAFLLRAATWLSIGITVTVIVSLVLHLVIVGVVRPAAADGGAFWRRVVGMFSLTYTTDNLSLLPSFINTLILAACTLILTVPIGIFAAIFLCEYAGRRLQPLVRVVRLATEALAGIPSIVYGLFGFLLFASKNPYQLFGRTVSIGFGWGSSLISGVLTAAIMVLPLIIRTTETALMSVPVPLREGSFGLGAGKLRTVFAIVLPSAMPGILAGVVLAMGRLVGETAAFIFAAGTIPKLPSSPFSSVRTLAVHIYSLLDQGMHMNEAYITAVFLLIVVVALNALSSWMAKRIVRGGRA